MIRSCFILEYLKVVVIYMIVMIRNSHCIYSIYWVIVFVYVDMIWIYVCDVVFIVDLCIDVCDIVDLFCFWYVM